LIFSHVGTFSRPSLHEVQRRDLAGIVYFSSTESYSFYAIIKSSRARFISHQCKSRTSVVVVIGLKSVHAIIIEIRKLPDEMSYLEDFDHVF
ncbi:hypothetical protein L9F63_009440, partial [Diploptera punctata]